MSQETTSSSDQPAGLPVQGSSSLPAPYESDGYAIGPHDYYAMSPADGEGTDWRRLIGILWRRKWWILAAGLLGAAVGVVGTNFIEPVYVTKATIWLDIPDPRGGGGPIRPDQVFGGQGWASVLESRAVLRPVAEERKLYINPIQPDTLDSRLFSSFSLGESALPGHYELDVDPSGTFVLSRQGAGQVQRGRVGEAIGQSVGFMWQPETLPSGKMQFEIMPMAATIANLTQALKTTFNSEASIITATLTWEQRRPAPVILNTILEQFIRTAGDLKNEKLRQQIEILKEQTSYAEDRLRDAELALQNFQVATITEPSDPQGGDPFPVGVSGPGRTASPTATVFGNYYAKRVQEDALQTDIQQLEGILSRWQAGDTIDILALRMIPAVNTAPHMSTLLNEYTAKQVDLRTLLYTYTEAHPDVINKRAEVSVLMGQALPAAIGQLVAQLKAQLGLLREQLAGDEADLQEIPLRSIELTRLQRELGSATAIHGSLQGNLKQVQLAEATNFPDIQILDSAVPAKESVDKQASRIIILGTLAGLGLGLGLVLLFNLLDKRIHYPEQITNRLGLPVLGIVPRLDAGRKRDTAEAQVAIESFRGIRTQLSHVGGNGRGITMITSPAPQDGKSMVAANLAISNATAGHQTVLVDTDTRRGRAQAMFQLHKSPGLTDYLLGRASLEEVRQETSVEGLTLIARGDSRGFNPDLLESGKMADFLELLRKEFDVIVLDAPPLVAGADALVVGEQSDKVVLVVRAGATDQDLARTKLEMLGNVPIPLVGAVLNAVPNTADYYRYYASYYYADAEAS